MVERITREQFYQHILGVLNLVVDVEQLRYEMEHDSEIFPDSTARMVEFVAGTPINTFSDWSEVEMILQ